MFNKSLAFGLLAAGLMVAPGAAFAGSQSQSNSQNTIQDGTAINGGVNAQSADSLSIQNQVQNTRERIGKGGRYGTYRRRYTRPAYCGSGYNAQSQNSSQGTVQSGVAADYSDNAQSGSSVNDQNQVASNSRSCR